MKKIENNFLIKNVKDETKENFNILKFLIRKKTNNEVKFQADLLEYLINKELKEIENKKGGTK